MSYYTILVSSNGDLQNDTNWLTNYGLSQGWTLRWMTATHQGVLLTFERHESEAE